MGLTARLCSNRDDFHTARVLRLHPRFALTILVFNLGARRCILYTGDGGVINFDTKLVNAVVGTYYTPQREDIIHHVKSSVALLLLPRSHRTSRESCAARVARGEQIIVLLELEGNILLKYEKKKKKK